MNKVISNLHEKSILHQDQVINIKKYINEKYKNEEASRKATIFAYAVHNIVDESVRKFEKEHRLKIRAEVLKTAIAKDVFDISGYDVFEVCSLLPIEKDSEKEDFYTNLTQWLNDNQDELVTIEETKAMTTQIIDDAVSGVVNLLEESILIDPKIKDLVAVNTEEATNGSHLPAEAQPLNPSEQITNYNDNPDLEDFITDGRFMNVEGESVELSALDIEKAIKDSKNVYGDLDGIEVDEKIDKDIINKAINKRKKSESERGKSDDGQVKTQEKSVDTSEVPLTKEAWIEVEDVNVIKVEKDRISGYDLKPPKLIEPNSGVSLKIKLIIIIPVAIVILALAIFLIAQVLGMSRRNTELESQLKQMKALVENSVTIENETLPSAGISATFNDKAFKTIEGVNYNEGGHLEESLNYKSINSELLKEYLESKNSVLSEDYYIEEFIQVAKDYNVNPLLLVAITGQEQNFVPKDHPDAELIKNNPFNVFISWKNYNTNFEDAAKIAARTILTSSIDKPEDEDPVKWINNIYAQDSDWHKGVSYFMDEMAYIMELE